MLAWLSRIAGWILPRRWLLIGVAVVGLPVLGYLAVQLYDWRIGQAEERGREQLQAEIETRSARQAIQQRDRLRETETRTGRDAQTLNDTIEDALEHVDSERAHNRFINRALNELRQRQAH